jgi:hypothetical protein
VSRMSARTTAIHKILRIIVLVRDEVFCITIIKCMYLGLSLLRISLELSKLMLSYLSYNLPLAQIRMQI